jgi:hypothetical protein
MEDYKAKLEKETQEILMTKGITRERMREIEEEVKEEIAQKYSQNGIHSPRTANSGAFSTFEESHLRTVTSHGAHQSGSNKDPQSMLETKMMIRNEIKKKERLLEVRMKQKLAKERKKLKNQIQDEFEQMKEDLSAQLKEERLELSRQKSQFNIQKRKL